MKQVFIKKDKNLSDQVDVLNEMFSGIMRDNNTTSETIAAQEARIATLENMVASLKKELGI